MLTSEPLSFYLQPFSSTPAFSPASFFHVPYNISLFFILNSQTVETAPSLKSKLITKDHLYFLHISYFALYLRCLSDVYLTGFSYFRA